mgnify:CR=1 FL=1
MNGNKKFSITNFRCSTTSIHLKKFRFILVFLSGIILFPIQLSKSEEIFLKCTGRYEINRGELIKPDWETSYLTINMDGLTSYIDHKGTRTEGRTLIRRNSYSIKHRNNKNKLISNYKIDAINGNYMVDHIELNRRLIGTCEKGRG